MKAISAIIVIILVLMIVVALAALSYAFFSGILTSTTETTEESIERATTTMLAQMKIESASGNNIYVRNTGQTDVSDFSVYINDKPADFNFPDTVEPGETATITITDFIKEGDDIKVVTARGTIFSEKASDPCNDAVLCLEMDEGSGTTTYDHSPYGNDGIFYNGCFIDGELKDYNITNYDGDTPPKRVDGKFGKALEFDSVDDYVEIPDDDSLDFDVTDSFTIEMWVKANNVSSTNRIDMVFLKYPGSAPDIRIYVRFGQFRAYIRDATGYVSVYSSLFPQINTWYHLALVRDVNEDKLLFYTNGNLIGNSIANDTTTFPLINSVPVKIGSSWNGTIDEVRIYRRALSQEEVQADMQSSIPITSAIGSWSFEGSGTFANNTRYWVKVKYGNALDFDGDDDYLNISNTISTTDSITVEAWVRPNNIGFTRHSIYTLGQQDPLGHHWLYYMSNSINWQYKNSSNYVEVSVPTSWNLNQWYHVAVTHDYTAKEVRFYRNGTLLDVIEHTDDVTPIPGRTSKIGAYSVSQHKLSGSIDEVRVYKKAIY